jgi:hypothetical protein
MLLCAIVEVDGLASVEGTLANVKFRVKLFNNVVGIEDSADDALTDVGLSTTLLGVTVELVEGAEVLDGVPLKVVLI